MTGDDFFFQFFYHEEKRVKGSPTPEFKVAPKMKLFSWLPPAL